MEDINTAWVLPQNVLEVSQDLSHLCSNISVALHLVNGLKIKDKEMEVYRNSTFGSLNIRNPNTEIASFASGTVMSLWDLHD